MKVEFAQSSRKHRVGRARILEVLANPEVVFTLEDLGMREDRLVFLGPDPSGRIVEVMDIRTKWRSMYEEGLQ